MKKQLIILSITIVNLYCSTALTVDEQIALIKKAPEDKRVILMNQFKRQLILMNQNQREEAIAQLRGEPSSENTIEHYPNDHHIQMLQQSNIEQQIEGLSATQLEEVIHQQITLPTSPTPPETEPANTPSVEPIPTIEQPESPTTPMPEQEPPMPSQQPEEIPISPTLPVTEPIQEPQPTIPNQPNSTPEPTLPQQDEAPDVPIQIPTQGGTF